MSFRVNGRQDGTRSIRRVQSVGGGYTRWEDPRTPSREIHTMQRAMGIELTEVIAWQRFSSESARAMLHLFA